MEESNGRKPRSKKEIAAKVVILAVILAVVILGVLRKGPCDPAPEPIPADCKPGQPCPVESETTGVQPEVNPENKP